MGGMGEVYRARDTKLNRDVALKVLPTAMASDAERMARFEREAQVMASLNHPNIASIYGLEESGGVRALVMELVEGPTLADRLQRGALPLEDALPVARQIAEALEAAHEKGITHRDLKPANVKVTPDGMVKVLDFGLAKAADDSAAPGDPSSSPTLTEAATQAGLIMGTAAYMAPEQARGHAVDRRADIWSFGAVLFEMLTGQRAFAGDTTSDVLASVLKSDPDWKALPASTPPAIVRLLRRCLTKDRKQRLQAIGEARIAIAEALSGDVAAGFTLASLSEVQRPPQGVDQRRHVLPWLAAFGMALLAGIAAWWTSAWRNPPGPDWSAQVLGCPSIAMGPRISPDGHTLAFQAFVDGLTQVAVMDTASGDWTALTKNRSRGYVNELNWSPDGSQIYFSRYLSAPHGVYMVSRFGGDERLVLDDAMGSEVLPDGSLLVIRLDKDRKSQLHRFWPDSKRLEALDALIAGTDFCPPVRAFRDGKDAVFYGETLEQDERDPTPRLYAMDLASGKTRRLGPELNVHWATSLDLLPIAVSSDDQSVLSEAVAGDLYRVVAIPRRGTGPVRTLFSLTLASIFMDVDKSGNVYLDQVDRPIDVLRFSPSGGAPEILTGPNSASASDYQISRLPDGGAVFASVFAGRPHLVVAKPGNEPAPFIQTKEETSLPACLLGDSEIAFMLGAPGHKVVAVASLGDGQIVRRLDDVPGNGVFDLAASPDGQTLYYVVSGTVWATTLSGGRPRRLGPGDGVAADPNGKDLIVQLNEKEGVRLFRVPVSGGAAQPIPIHSPLPLGDTLLSPNAVGKDGRVLLSLNTPDSWFFKAGILDPRSAKLTEIQLNFSGDLIAPGWLNDGRILSSGWPLRSTLWRFHPEEKGEQ
jgi:eukaryotic-like serine/threonine-protein kinase